jgi:hypothetical protein
MSIKLSYPGPPLTDYKRVMRLPTPILFLACLLTPSLAAALAPAAAGSATVSFHISDETDPVEVREATTVFINGHLVAHFELDPVHRYADVTVTVPASERYDYALCGRITIRAPDGHSETHVLDDGATLLDPAGRHLEALAANGFTTFFLAERNGTNSLAPSDLHRTNVCSIPTS